MSGVRLRDVYLTRLRRRNGEFKCTAGRLWSEDDGVCFGSRLAKTYSVFKSVR